MEEQGKMGEKQEEREKKVNMQTDEEKRTRYRQKAKEHTNRLCGGCGGGLVGEA